MINKKTFGGILCIVFVFGLFLSSCASNPLGVASFGTSTTKKQSFDRKQMDLIGSPKYTILGPVLVEKKWHGFVGFSIPGIGSTPPFDVFYLLQWGGLSYIDILEEAKRLYGNDVDAVIDINIDHSNTSLLIFYTNRKYTASGFAVKYSRDEVE